MYIVLYKNPYIILPLVITFEISFAIILVNPAFVSNNTALPKIIVASKSRNSCFLNGWKRRIKNKQTKVNNRLLNMSMYFLLHRPERKMRQKCNKNILLNFI